MKSLSYSKHLIGIHKLLMTSVYYPTHYKGPTLSINSICHGITNGIYEGYYYKPMAPTVFPLDRLSHVRRKYCYRL